MALEIGSRLGHYTVDALIGEGGMGQVYQATDTKLNRQVALKILPEAFASDPDRLARFQREAQVLASLNHPGIAAIYGIEEADDTRALVLELVDGPTLADRIAEGPIPVDEALPIAKQIAEALEAAHEQGVIHRDLKPANIKLKPDGTVKVLDFGLAKALDTAPEGDPSQSPTLTAAATQMGVIMGTAAYMSPEQARGSVADRRADIWSFGVVLYEMLTGERLFTGATVSDTLASVLKTEVDMNALPADVPPTAHRLLRRCLAREGRHRTQHIGDVRIELLDAEGETHSDARPGLAGSHTSKVWRTAALTGVAAALLSGVAVWTLTNRVEPSPPLTTRFALTVPAGHRLIALEQEGSERAWLPYPPFAVAPDGRAITFVASAPDGLPRLYFRDLDQMDARAIPGTENASLPFFSPDGRWIGFWSNGVLSRVSTQGGAPVTITNLSFRSRGAAWAPDDSIILGGQNLGLQRIDVNGGGPVTLTQPDADRGEQYHGWPTVLPDGVHVLFTAVTGDSSDIGILSLETEQWDILEGTSGAAQPHYLDSGHLVFFRSGGLFAADLDVTGPGQSVSAILVQDEVMAGQDAGLELGVFALSRSGTLIHGAAEFEAEQNRVLLVDQEGRPQPLPIDAGRYGYGPQVSPDGRQMVTSQRAGRTSGDCVVHDLELGGRTRLTDQNACIYPVWSSDGSRVIFSYFTPGPESFDVHWMPADRSAGQEVLRTEHRDQFPTSTSADGRLLAYTSETDETGQDIHLLTLDGERVSSPFRVTPANEFEASISPDSRFVAYVSDETGQGEVYVRDLSGDGGEVPISTDGGRWPRWSPTGDELTYMRVSTTPAMMAVPVDLGSTFRRLGAPEQLFEGDYELWFDVVRAGPYYLPDTTRFLMITRERTELTEVNLVLNWLTELAVQVPVDQ